MPQSHLITRSVMDAAKVFVLILSILAVGILAYLEMKSRRSRLQSQASPEGDRSGYEEDTVVATHANSPSAIVSAAALHKSRLRRTFCAKPSAGKELSR